MSPNTWFNLLLVADMAITLWYADTYCKVADLQRKLEETLKELNKK